MKKFAVGGLLASALMAGLQPAVMAQGSHGHLVVGNLQADCRRGGGPSSASFVTYRGHHALLLRAQTTTTANNANGEASANVLNLNGIRFQSIAVQLAGDCFINQKALFEIFVGFTPPGGSPSGLSFACNAIQVPGHPGLLRVTPNSIARDGVSQIPANSVLTEVLINEQSGDPDVGSIEAYVFDVAINNHHIPFDFNAPAAFCSPE